MSSYKTDVFIVLVGGGGGVGGGGVVGVVGGMFKNTYELLNPRALNISILYEYHIFQCMGKVFFVEFQRLSYPYIERYKE